MTFDSHVLNLVDVAARLVNHLTAGESGGVEVAVPTGPARRPAVAAALGGEGRRTPSVRWLTSRAATSTRFRT
jgi:hypothetical protein